ncbi:MAG: thioredoxin domain-containing protein [Blastocatellia bacterium]|nr:thioredoxin domain-containing protein [Blastocatellia bacterium]
MKRYLPFVIIGAVLLIALAAGFWMYNSGQPEPAPTTAALPAASPAAAAPATRGVVVIEEFGDYQCPPCGAVHPLIKKVKAEFGPRVRIFFYHLPLTQVHKNAMDAAHAAVAAGLQGRFWEMHDLLYANQQTWSEAEDLHPYALSLARQLGLDVNRFAADMDSPQVDATVATDLQRAASRGVNSTPTLFIDGQMVDNEKLSLESLRKDLLQRLQ